MLKLHVVFAVDRAGLVGEDGETHHGIFDVGFLRQVPNLLILAPSSKQELKKMLTWAVEQYDGPVAIRYPRGTDGAYKDSAFTDVNTDVVCHRAGKDLTILTYGNLLDNAMQAAELLSEKGMEATVLRLMRLSDISGRAILDKLPDSERVIVLEETCAHSGIKEAVSWELAKYGKFRVEGLDLGHRYVTHGSVPSLHEYYGISREKIAEFIMEGVAVES